MRSNTTLQKSPGCFSFTTSLAKPIILVKEGLHHTNHCLDHYFLRHLSCRVPFALCGLNAVFFYFSSCTLLLWQTRSHGPAFVCLLWDASHFSACCEMQLHRQWKKKHKLTIKIFCIWIGCIFSLYYYSAFIFIHRTLWPSSLKWGGCWSHTHSYYKPYDELLFHPSTFPPISPWHWHSSTITTWVLLVPFSTPCWSSAESLGCIPCSSLAERNS